MAYIFYNANPCKLRTGDCVVRACSTTLDKPWHRTHHELSMLSNSMCDMPSANVAWGTYLEQSGMTYHEPIYIGGHYTVRQFCDDHPYGAYVIGTGTHAVSVIDGNYYDIWDSGDEPVSYYFERS